MEQCPNVASDHFLFIQEYILHLKVKREILGFVDLPV